MVCRVIEDRESMILIYMEAGVRLSNPCFHIYKYICENISYPLYSSDTVNFFLPLARRLANTLRPFAVAILERKPCLFFLFLFEG